jgi:pimeloyl-ACP methyl ester carboxylesterase
MPTIERDSISIHFESTGDGRPVVFLHGWTMDHELWDRQVTALAASYRCVTVDLRGHGHSSKPIEGYGYDEHVKDIHALLEALDLRHAALVGSSMGGAIAIQLTALHPERVAQVVTVGTPPQLVADDRWPEGRPREVVGAFLEAQRVAREQTMRTIVEESVHAELDEATNAWLFQIALRSPSWAAIGSWKGALASSAVPFIGRLTAPLFVIHGRHDAFVSNEAAARLAAEAPHSRLAWFENSAHFPFLEETELFNRELAGFLSEVPAG